MIDELNPPDGPRDVDDDLAPDSDVASRGSRSATIAAVAVAIVVAVLVAILATGDPSTERATQSPLLGKAAPTIAGGTLTGDTFDLDAYRGRWVVVNFFATWCIPCWTEHPELVAFETSHASAGDASVVSVLFDDTPEEAREFFEEQGGTWPVVIDAQGAVSVAYGVARVPESFLVSPTGIVVQRLVGGVTAAQLDALIDSIEAGTA